MSNNKKRINPGYSKLGEQVVDFRGSYDTIPQPKGKFKDLFQQMELKQKANDTPSNTKHKPSN